MTDEELFEELFKKKYPNHQENNHTYAKLGVLDFFLAGIAEGREQALNGIFQINGPSRAITKLREKWKIK